MKLPSVSRTLCGLLLLSALPLPSSAEVLKIVVNDTIHPITDEYIGRALAEAERNKDQALLIEIEYSGRPARLDPQHHREDSGLAGSGDHLRDAEREPRGIGWIFYSAKAPTSPPWLREPIPARPIP